MDVLDDAEENKNEGIVEALSEELDVIDDAQDYKNEGNLDEDFFGHLEQNDENDGLDTFSESQNKLSASACFDEVFSQFPVPDKQKRTRSSLANTAKNYVWIKERRTTFTGLTFDQRERGMINRRSMTMKSTTE